MSVIQTTLPHFPDALRVQAVDGFVQQHEGEVRIYDPVDPKAVGQVLIQAGIAVEEMSLHRQDLEGCFLERMGGEKHV